MLQETLKCKVPHPEDFSSVRKEKERLHKDSGNSFQKCKTCFDLRIYILLHSTVLTLSFLETANKVLVGRQNRNFNLAL